MTQKKEITFKERVLEVVRMIPAGKTMSYKEVAIKAGNPLAARAVGMIMSKNRDPLIPCHRVVGTDGKLKGFYYGVEVKKAMLEQEKQTGKSYVKPR